MKFNKIKAFLDSIQILAEIPIFNKIILKATI